MDWSGYKLYEPGITGPVKMLPRAEAKQVFDQCMAQKAARLDMLCLLLKQNEIRVARTNPALQHLNDWFVANVTPDPDNPGSLTPAWYSLVHDVALVLGDVVLERCPGLRWEFYTRGKKDVSFQRHVIVGFTQIANPKYHLDVYHRVSIYAHYIVAARGSVAHYGKVNVRGVEIDVDAAVARQPARKIVPDAFLRWTMLAESEA